VEGGGWTAGWKELRPQGDLPPPRAHHTAVLLAKSQMIVYGGIHLDDMWTYSIDGNSWAKVQQSSTHDDSRMPGKRHGHSAVEGADEDGFYLFGGFRFAEDAAEGDSSGPLEDLWHFALASGAWTQMAVSHPKGGRTYASLLLRGGQLFAFAGGRLLVSLWFVLFGCLIILSMCDNVKGRRCTRAGGGGGWLYWCFCPCAGRA
jgi:hypothetical protein